MLAIAGDYAILPVLAKPPNIAATLIWGRHRGLMFGIDVDSDAKTLRTRCRELGLLVCGGGPGTIRLLPPLIVESAHLQEALDLLSRALVA